ncbi:MAG: hypothetical protein FJ304_12365 [Planctomycetes bacterium]|nr:hypothetical protein [Planctomycetota bacterium]
MRAWEYETKGGLPQAVAVDQKDRKHLFVALKNGGLAVLALDGANAPPKQVAKLGTDRFGNLDAMNLAQRGELLFVALGDFFAAKGAHAGLAVVNVANPAAPKVVALWTSPHPVKGAAVVAVDAKYAYLGAMTEGVMVFDVTNPAKIKHVSTFQPDVHFPRTKPNAVQHPNARGMALAGDRLYLAYDAGGLRVLDVSDRARPKEIGRYANAAMMKKQQAFNNVVLDGDLLYAATDYAGLEVLNVKNPAQIKQIGWWNPWEADTLKNVWFNSGGHTNQIGYDRKQKLVFLSAGKSELQVVDVSAPARPVLARHYATDKAERGAWGVTLADDVAYLTYIQAVIPFKGTWSGVVAVKTK